MPLNVEAVEHALFDAPAMHGPIQNKILRGEQFAIGMVNAGNMFGVHPATFIPNVQNWRVDRQAPPLGYINISVQRNGITNSPSTVATVFVPLTLNPAPPPGGPNNLVHQARMRELERVTRRGLEMSLASHQPVRDHGWYIRRYRVTGQFSA